MKKNLLYILVAVLFIASCAKSTYQYPAVFGERMDRAMGYERVVRIFMDKEGLYYPDIFIKDRELRKLNGSLRDWYKKHPLILSALYKKYQVKDTTGSIDDNIDRLDDAIARIYVRDINQMAHDYMVVGINIHGFRKKAYGSSTDLGTSSRKEFQELEGALLMGTRKDVLFVEVYWDANFFSAFKNANKAASVFYHNTIPSAMNVGLKLRKIVPLIDKNKEINIVTHNIAARVAAELLFNASGGFMQGESIYNTPAQKNIRVCMIAPAVSSSLFDNYNNRNPYAPVSGDNYELSIVYNENDLVCRKKLKLGPLVSGHLSPADSGNTALGCNYEGDIAKLKDIIKQPNLRTFDLSKKSRDTGRSGSKRKCSDIYGCYISNTVKFNAVADYLGDKATYVPPAPFVPADRKKRAGQRTVLTQAEKDKIKADRKAMEKLKAEEKARKEKEQREKAKQKEKERKLLEQEKARAAKEKLQQKAEQQKIAGQQQKDAALLKAEEKKQAEKEKRDQAKLKENEKRQKELEREEIAKQKAAERKAQEKERAAAAKLKDQERKQKEKERAEATKQRAEERKQAQKEKEAAAKLAEKEKAAAAKQLAREKEEAARLKAEERKAAEREKAEAAKLAAKEKAAAAKQREEERKQAERERKEAAKEKAKSKK